VFSSNLEVQLIPWCKEAANINVKQGESSVESNFNNLVGSLSGPRDLDALIQVV